MRRLLVLLCALVVSSPALAGDKVNGYAEYRMADTLVVEGQVIRAFAGTQLKGAASAGLANIPLGYEVEAEGDRQADGSILARKVEAKPNGSAMFESDVLAATNEIESIWVNQGRMFEPTEGGGGETIGRLISGGPYFDRVSRITRRLAPPYVDFNRQIRLHIVETNEWNAAAMGNGAIWVYTGLMDSMTDDELAIVLGHEIAHYTHEHTRRQAKAGMWQGLAGLGAILIGEAIGTDTSRAVAGISAAIGLTVWGSGYSRDHEDQADRVGLRYAYQGGFDVAAGVSLWGKFRAKYGEPDKITNFFFGSHSRPSDRIRNIEREVRTNYRTRVEAMATTRVDFPELSAPASPAEATTPADADANQWVAQVQGQLDAFRRDQVPAGYASWVPPQLDQLGARQMHTAQIPVQPGMSFLIIAVCDADCSDLDLVLTDARGNLITADQKEDDYPMVAYQGTSPEPLSLQVQMITCAAETCVYGYEIYAKR